MKIHSTGHDRDRAVVSFWMTWLLLHDTHHAVHVPHVTSPVPLPANRHPHPHELQIRLGYTPQIGSMAMPSH